MTTDSPFESVNRLRENREMRRLARMRHTLDVLRYVGLAALALAALLFAAWLETDDYVRMFGP